MTEASKTVEGLSGRPFEVQPGQEVSAYQAGIKPMDPEQASREHQAWNDMRELDQNWSAPEKVAAGVFGGATLGLGPAALAKLGLTNQRTIEALGGSSAYGVGEGLGLIAPAVLTGGESLAAEGAMAGAARGGEGVIARALAATPSGLLTRAGTAAEALAGRLLPEAGVMGKLARPAFQMAARGGAEGALISMSHTAADSMTYDKPLAWSSMISSGVDGALMGGLLGAGAGTLMGGFSALSSGVVGIGAGRGGEASAGKVLRRLGASEEKAAALGAREGGTIGSVKAFHDILDSQGESFASKTPQVLAAAKKAGANAEVLSNGIIQDLDKEAPGWVPRQERVAGRIQTDLDGKYLQTFRNEEAQKLGGSVNERLGQLQVNPLQPPAPFDMEAPSWDVQPYGVKQPKFKEFTKTFTEKPFTKTAPELKQATSKKVGNQTIWQTHTPAYQEELAAFKAAKEAHGAEQTKLGKEFAAAKEAHYSEQNRLQSEWAAANEAHIKEQEAVQDRYLTAKKLYDEAAVATPKPGATWEAWAKSRSQLQDLVDTARGTVKEDVYRTALNAMDSEIRMAMEEASQAIGKEGISESYHGALMTKKISKELEEMVAGKLAKETVAGKGIHLTSPDLGALAYSTLGGHPFGGAVIVAGKKVAKHIQESLEPAMAEAAYRAAIGAEAGSAVIKTGQRIDKAISKFLGVAPRITVGEVEDHPKSPPVRYTRKDFEEALARTEQLTSQEHEAAVLKFAGQLDAAGHPDLAQAAIDQYQTAAAYLRYNMPVGKQLKQAQKLGKAPSPMGLNTKEMKFMRIDRAIKNPMSIVDDLMKGSVSRDAVKAIKTTNPPLHSEIVTRFHGALMAMKEEGKFVPADKVALAGLVLDSPVDSTLEKGFIDKVQAALAANAQPQPKADEQQGGAAPITDSSSFQTPTQSALQA